MNAGNLMTAGARTCSLNDSLNLAAQLMWENDCGCVPVVDEDGRAVAMITDRDICMAAYTQGKLLKDMPVSSAASRALIEVAQDDNIEKAEALMRMHQIRRIVVVDSSHRPVGVLSLNDIIRHADFTKDRRDGLNPESIVGTLDAICQHSHAHAHAAE